MPSRIKSLWNAFRSSTVYLYEPLVGVLGCAGMRACSFTWFCLAVGSLVVAWVS